MLFRSDRERELRRSELLENVADTLYQPLYAALSKLRKDFLSFQSSTMNAGFEAACTEFSETAMELMRNGQDLYLDTSLNECLENLLNLLANSINASEIKVRVEATGPGTKKWFSDPGSDILQGDKAERLFELPDLESRPNAAYQIHVAEVLAAPPRSKAFAWAIENLIHTARTQIKDILHV